MKNLTNDFAATAFHLKAMDWDRSLDIIENLPPEKREGLHDTILEIVTEVAKTGTSEERKKALHLASSPKLFSRKEFLNIYAHVRDNRKDNNQEQPQSREMMI